MPADPGDTAVRLIGTLRRAPEWHGLGTYLDVQLHSVDGQAYRGRARLTEFLEDPETRQLFDRLDLGSGDRLQIVVKLRRPSVYRDPGVFDFRRYLEREGIYWTGTIRNPRLIMVLERGWHGPDRIKNWIQARLEAPFQSDRNIQGLISGMVLGRKDGLTAEVERQFQAGGLYHLVVVSGFNLAVVSSVAMWLAGFIPWRRRSRLLFVLTCATSYALMVRKAARSWLLSDEHRGSRRICHSRVRSFLDRGLQFSNDVRCRRRSHRPRRPGQSMDLWVAAGCPQGFQRSFKRHLSAGPGRRLANGAADMVRAAWIANVGPDDSMEHFSGNRRSGDRIDRGRDDVSTFYGGILSSVLSHFPFAEHPRWYRRIHCYPAGTAGDPAARAAGFYCSVEHHADPCGTPAHPGLGRPVARRDLTRAVGTGLALGELRCGRPFACVRDT